jgi:hypothetical protein
MIQYFYSIPQYPTLIKIPESETLIRNIFACLPYNSIEGQLKMVITYNKPIFHNSCTEISTPNTFFEDITQKIYEYYLIDRRLKWQFRRLLLAWRVRRINAKSSPSIDPITLSPPETPLEVYDIKTGRKYTFDAKNIYRSINQYLLTQEYSFPKPIEPKNLFTNTPFTYSQLVSIYIKLKKLGHMSWVLSTFKSSNFNIDIWKLFNNSAITLHAISGNLNRLDTQDGRFQLYNYIKDRAYECDLAHDDEDLLSFKNALMRYPDHPLIQSMKANALLYYKMEHFSLNAEDLILVAFMNLYEKQNILEEYIRKKTHGK